MSMEIKIEHHLDKKIREIEIDIKYDNFQTRKTEDFFLRLLNKVYTQYNFKNLGYDKTNTAAIDLIDDNNKQLGIQVTAQKTDETGKIDGTLEKALKYWKKKGVKTIWILFISETNKIKGFDTINEHCNKDGISIFIRTPSSIVGDIYQKALSEQIQIDEFLKQEVSEQYSGLSKLSNFKFISIGERFVRDRFFNFSETIYYSKKELTTINYLANNFGKGKLKEYCILGNPCSGKTTFAYSIIQKISNRKIFYLNLSNPSISDTQIIEELIQISHNYSFVVIDNIHDNIELFRVIRKKISEFKLINTLYLSRYYKTYDYYNDENIYRLIDGIKYYWINTNDNFEEKVSGIISKKIKLLKESRNQLEWNKGDIVKILKNTNRNLLKLNIALKTWELKNSKNSPISFDEINSDRILDQFYEIHKLEEIKSDALYTYSLLFKNDIPFTLLRNTRKENALLREKGVILQYFQSDFCFFPHKEYAQIIFDAFNYNDNGISSAKRVSLILNYIDCFDTSENKIGLRFILSKLHYSDDKDILGEILNEEKVLLLLQNEISDSVTTVAQVIATVNILFTHLEKIAKERLEKYYKTFLTFFHNHKLSLFLEDYYLAYSRLLQISNWLKVELNDEFVTIVLRPNERANTNSVVELTLRVSRKYRESQTILRILNSFTFPEWLQMIVELPRLPNLTNSLSELNRSSESKKLLAGLFRNIDWKKEYEKAKSLKVDQFVKSLREINRIDNSIGTNISRFFFKNALRDSLFNNKLKSANLSEYAKALSDLSKIDSTFVKSKLADDLRSNIVFEKFSNEPSISNFTARALELRKHFEDTKAYFSVLNKIVLTDSFIKKIQEETNLNYLLIFTEFAEKYLNFEKSILKYETSKAITELIASLPNKLDALSNPKFLNVENLDSNFIDSLSTDEIEKYFKTNKITYAEDLFRVLSTIDKKKTIDKFKKLNNSVLIRAFLNPELNFCQAIENINKLKNKVYKDGELNANSKISEIFNDYLLTYTKDHRRYKRVSVSDFFKGYYFGLCVDQFTIEKYCKNDFEAKLKSQNHKNFEIASLFQFVRRLSEIENKNNDKSLLEFLELNTNNFIETIKNEQITKTLSGLCELTLTDFDDFADELLFKSRNWVIKKVKQRKHQKIYKVKLLPDLEKIAKNKGRVVLRELK